MTSLDFTSQDIDIAEAYRGIVAERRKRSLAEFARDAWPQIMPQKLVWNWHLDAVCEHLTAVTTGEIRFLMINLPPRHTKSAVASVIWPVWDWLHRPGRQFLSASVDERLALEFARLSRRLMESEWFMKLYPDAPALLADENQAKMYRNSASGYRATASVQGRVIGTGGDIQILDDPHDAKKVESDAVRQATLTWHDNSWRSRLNDPKRGQKVYIGQRTHDMDIFGHVIEQEGRRWVNVVLPLEFDPKRICITRANDGKGNLGRVLFTDPRKEKGELLDPKRFDSDTASAEKEVMSPRAWQAQYQQQPEGSGGLILKRDWWKEWVFPEWHPQAGESRPMPEFFEVIQSYDTAFEESQESDFSARTTWGLFRLAEMERDERTGTMREGRERVCAMMLDMMEERLSYPDLREEVIRSDRDFAPDVILIEKKSSGHSLLQELRRKRLPVKAFGLRGSSGRGGGQGDLVARAHEASLMLEKGCIWYVPRQWAFKVIEQAAKFPNADHDDVVSSLTMAWQYMRKYHDLTLPDDERADEVNPYSWRRQEQKKSYASY